MDENLKPQNIQNPNIIEPSKKLAPTPQTQEEKQRGVIDKIQGKNYLIRPLRTYEDDVSAFVKKKKVSVSNILAAEQKKRYTQQQSTPTEGPSIKEQAMQQVAPNKLKGDSLTKSDKDYGKLIKIIIGVALVLGGLGIIIFSFIHFDLSNKISTVIPKGNTGPTEVIEKDLNIKILANNKTGTEIIGEIKNSIDSAINLDNNKIVEIQILVNRSFEENSSSNTAQDQITTQEFFNVLESVAPGSLIRSLNEEYFLGVLKLENPEPFILFKTDVFDQSYAAMLEWEDFIVRDIDEIFPNVKTPESDPTPRSIFSNEQPQIATSTKNSTSTATSTAEIDLGSTFNPRNFEDVVLINRDTRAIIDSEGKILFFYSFIDNENLILTSDIEVMREIIQRLNTQKLIR